MDRDDHLYVNVMAFGHLVGVTFVVLLIVLFSETPWVGGALSLALVAFVILKHRTRLGLEQHRLGIVFQAVFVTAFTLLWIYFMLRPEFTPALAIAPILCSAYEYALAQSSGNAA